MDVTIVRSARRAKTVSAREVDGVLVVQAPADLGDAELQVIVARLQRRLETRRATRALPVSDAALEREAHALNGRYFGGQLRWASVRWVTNQQSSRWGSCTPARGVIRLSHRLAAFPVWVWRYVLMHELAHLVEAGHGPAFWALVHRYELTERARGYLMAKAGDDREDEAM